MFSGITADAALRRRLLERGDIEHPNAASIAGVGQPSPRDIRIAFWASSAYVPGFDLEELSRRVGPLPLGPILGCARQTLQGLRQFHERGLAHGSVTADHLIAGTGRDTAVLLPTGGLRMSNGVRPF